MASGSNNSKYMTEAGIYVDSVGYDERFMDGLQYNISDWIENGGEYPSDKFTEDSRQQMNFDLTVGETKYKC